MFMSMFSIIICGISLCAEVFYALGTPQFRVASYCNKVIYGQFYDYPMFKGGKMGNQEEKSLKEAKRLEKRVAEEAERLAKEKERKKAYLAREQVIEEAQRERETKRSAKRAAEEIEQLAREQARREAYLAREKAIAEAQEAKKLKVKNQPPE
jgi:hypothetical protein